MEYGRITITGELRDDGEMFVVVETSGELPWVTALGMLSIAQRELWDRGWEGEFECR